MNIVWYGPMPSCYPGLMNVRIGAIDYTNGLDMMVNPLAENAIWQTIVGTLNASSLQLDYSYDTLMPGANMVTDTLGQPYSTDITTALKQAIAHGNPSGKPYAFCFLSIGGPGKIYLLSAESTTPYDRLIGIEVTDDSGTYLFKYKKEGGDYENSIFDRIQYTGLRTANQNYNDAFNVGGYEGGPPGSNYDGVSEQRCAFFFHRGLAAKLGWEDPLYPNDTLAIGVDHISEVASPGLKLQTSPNPFSASTRIVFALENETQVKLAIYAINGKLVRVLASGRHSGGLHVMTWTGIDVPQGVYILRLKAGKRVLERKTIKL